ncbi:hypothetical protein KX928_00135 [Roseobacter sp. YSTF-M11]|uniref:Uncharacterized protein n=1 Tax=Roseobacter insulae TaxID=2859783 RepID=A0A9X1JWR8_9RHOB|nr:hypothetical protein [Roseobacter insulae]MBW4706186.1 hypothetical protein [Roseobacter insulae]
MSFRPGGADAWWSLRHALHLAAVDAAHAARHAGEAGISTGFVTDTVEGSDHRHLIRRNAGFSDNMPLELDDGKRPTVPPLSRPPDEHHHFLAVTRGPSCRPTDLHQAVRRESLASLGRSRRKKGIEDYAKHRGECH